MLAPSGAQARREAGGRHPAPQAGAGLPVALPAVVEGHEVEVAGRGARPTPAKPSTSARTEASSMVTGAPRWYQLFERVTRRGGTGRRVST